MINIPYEAAAEERDTDVEDVRLDQWNVLIVARLFPADKTEVIPG